MMKRDRLKKLAADKRFIPGIYNYCDRWCERCPQTAHCLNFAISEEDSSDPESRDIRNEAFWKKLSGIFQETLEMLKESAKEWGVDLETLDSAEDMEKMKARDEAAENHLLCRAARKYAEMVKDWVDEKETLFFETAAAARDGVDLDEAIEVIQWYQYFICAKITRAVRGKVEDEEERDDEFPSDSDGSAKIALIAMDRSVAAWAMIRHYDADGAESVVDLIAFLDGLRQAVEKTFPRARSFVRPGFDRLDQNG
jgi:hypothetical protein